MQAGRLGVHANVSVWAATLCHGNALDGNAGCGCVPPEGHLLARVRTAHRLMFDRGGLGWLQSIIVSCVHSLYGDVGLPGEVDVLQVLKDKTAVLRVPFDKQVRRSFTPAAKLCAAPLSKSPCNETRAEISEED